MISLAETTELAVKASRRQVEKSENSGSNPSRGQNQQNRGRDNGVEVTGVDGGEEVEMTRGSSGGRSRGSGGRGGGRGSAQFDPLSVLPVWGAWPFGP